MSSVEDWAYRSLGILTMKPVNGDWPASDSYELLARDLAQLFVTEGGGR